MGLNRQIFKIAIPSIIGFLGLILFQSADVYWIGKLGSKPVAAMGAAFFLEWLLYALMNLSVTGCGTLVSQFIGAQSEERFNVIRAAVMDDFFFALFSGYSGRFNIFFS